MRTQRGIYEGVKKYMAEQGLTPERGRGLLYDLKLNGDSALCDLGNVRYATGVVERYGMIVEGAVPDLSYVTDKFARSWVGNDIGYGWGDSAESALRAEDQVLDAAARAGAVISNDERLHPETRAVWGTVLNGSPLDKLDPTIKAIGIFGALQEARKKVAEEKASHVVTTHTDGYRTIPLALARDNREHKRPDPFNYRRGQITLGMDVAVAPDRDNGHFWATSSPDLTVLTVLDSSLLNGTPSRRLRPFQPDFRLGELAQLADPMLPRSRDRASGSEEYPAEDPANQETRKLLLRMIEFALCKAGVEPHAQFSDGIRA